MTILDLARVKQAHTRFLAANERMVTSVLERTGTFAENYVRQHPTFKRRTGKTQDKTSHRVVKLKSGATLVIKNTAKHAMALEYGSRPHVIRPRRAIFLRFMVKGKAVFARKVNHPGNKPYKFLYRALNASGRIVEPNLRDDMAEIARKF